MHSLSKACLGFLEKRSCFLIIETFPAFISQCCESRAHSGAGNSPWYRAKGHRGGLQLRCSLCHTQRGFGSRICIRSFLGYKGSPGTKSNVPSL